MTIRVAARFCGPPGAANGGCIAGLLVGDRDEPMQVTLRRPVPLETDLAISEEGEAAFLMHEDHLLVEAEPCRLELDVPAAPDYGGALDASTRYIALHEHPFPRCFVCGTHRLVGDGLRLFAGPVRGQQLVAAPWIPDPTISTADGLVHPFVTWAALDCPGAYADLLGRLPVPQVLGRIAAHVERLPSVDERYVVIGWPTGRDGRKHYVGTAIVDSAGRVLAKARATWFEFDRTVPVSGQ